MIIEVTDRGADYCASAEIEQPIEGEFGLTGVRLAADE